jgi:nucleoside-diphosphate-sugar epimerase
MIFGYGYGDHGDGLVGESSPTSPFGPKGADPALERIVGAMRTKEELILGADGVEGVALRFGLFYGAGVTDTTVLAMLRKRALPVVAERGRALPWVEVGDAARAIALTVSGGGAAGRAFNIVDDTPTSFGAHVRAVARSFGAPRPLTVPLWMLRATPFAHAMLSTNLRVANTRAKAELHWKPTYAGSIEGVAALAHASTGR